MTGLYLDHVLIAVRDLEETTRTLGDRLGFTLTPPGLHPGRGTHNRLIVFGPEYLEIISIHDPTQRLYRPYLATFLEAREGLFMFAMGTGDVDRWFSRLRERGVATVSPVDGSRDSGGGDAYSWRQMEIAPDETPGSRTFLIQHHQTVSQRYTEPPDAGAHANGVVGIHLLELAVHDADSAAGRWTDAFDLRTVSATDDEEEGVRRVRLDLVNCFLDLLSPLRPGPVSRFLDSVGQGPFRLSLKVGDLEQSATLLHRRGVSTVEAAREPDGPAVLVAPEDAHGVPLRFVDVSRSSAEG